ncbi:hypothetical protein G6011_02754 [Alternaria panax]|uniref:Uncharacterized protein n=1 Tax=Alternaria panax TaxID=48097 RepID=A0AAD4FCB6_9PLEO|nr:hypothetical protein G6011_02754 [Alternaria panax]
MKFPAATTLFLAALALASPAPLANPDAVAEPITIESREQFRNALSARTVLTVPEIQLEERASSGGKGGKGGKGGGNSSSAASDILSPNRALQVAALGLGVVEVVRQWV